MQFAWTTSLLLLSSCVLVSAARRRSRNFLSLSAEMQPEVVAHSLVNVENDWRASVHSALNCKEANCGGMPQSFEQSCATIVNAVLQASSGDRGIVQEYLDEVCAEDQLKGWRNKFCKSFTNSVSAAMTADVYENRESMNIPGVCHEFWQALTDDEREETEKQVGVASTPAVHASVSQKHSEHAGHHQAVKAEAKAKAKAKVEAKAKAKAKAPSAAEEERAKVAEKEAEDSQREIDETLAEAKRAIAAETPALRLQSQPTRTPAESAPAAAQSPATSLHEEAAPKKPGPQLQKTHSVAPEVDSTQGQQAHLAEVRPEAEESSHVTPKQLAAKATATPSAANTKTAEAGVKTTV